MVRWTLSDPLAFLLLLSLLLPSLLIMFIPSTFKRPVSSWKALNLRKTLLMASSVRLKPLNCSRLPCVYAQETLTFLLTQKKTCVKNYVQKEDRKSGSAGMPRPISYAVFCLKKKKGRNVGRIWTRAPGPVRTSRGGISCDHVNLCLTA